jgi:hypothetical protein
VQQMISVSRRDATDAQVSKPDCPIAARVPKRAQTWFATQRPHFL